MALNAPPKTLNQSWKRSNTGLSVAVLTQGGTEWIAGRIYIANLIGALNLLPEEERITVSQIAPPTSSHADLSDSGAVLRAHWFAFRATDPVADKLRGAKAGLRHGKWPQSLETAVKQARAAVAFPVLDSLGREFPIPWIGWIPDFQHKRLPHFFPEEEISRRDRRFQEIVDHAWHVVVSSEDARRDLSQWFPTEASRHSVFPFVSVINDKWREEDSAKVAAQFDLPEGKIRGLRIIVLTSYNSFQTCSLAEVELICNRIGLIREGHLLRIGTMQQIRTLRTHPVSAAAWVVAGGWQAKSLLRMR